MNGSNSDLSEVSELEFFSLRSYTSEDEHNSEVTSYNSADETLSLPSSSLIERKDSTYKAELPCCEEVESSPLMVPPSSLSNKSYPTTKDVISSQIFEGWDSPTKSNDIKLRFNECVQFFSTLSTKNKERKICEIDAVNGNICSCPKVKWYSKPKQSMDKSTCTEPCVQEHVSVQTDPPQNPFGKENVFDQFSRVQDLNEDGEADTVCSSEVVTASATSVASLLNERSNSRFSSNSTANSTHSGVAAIQASTKAISSAIKDLDRQYASLINQGEFTIELSTICVLNKAFAPNFSNSTGTHKSPSLKFPIVKRLYIANISDSSTNSSTTDDSLPETSQIFVATPFTINPVMTEESFPIPPVPPSSLGQLNGSNRNLLLSGISQIDSEVAYAVAERNIEYSNILQNTFFRTSTPLRGIGFKRKCISHMDVFPSSSFVKSLSFKELKTEPFINNNSSKSLDSRQKNKSRTFDSNIVKLGDRRVFVSLYNLTCSPISGSKLPITQPNNPTNVFFNNSQSYISLKETDIDSGKEMSKPLYKETNLDNCSQSPKSSSLKAKSLSNICKADNGNSLAVCEDFDENILNHNPNYSSLSISTNLLYVRLKENAKTPAQLRVAKSITKLNIPDWMNSVDFREEKKEAGRKCAPQQVEPEIYSSGTKHRLQAPAKKIKSMSPKMKHPIQHESSSFSLPSTQFQSSEIKLQPIRISKARQALDLSKSKVLVPPSIYDHSASMVAFSKEFLSRVNYKEKDFQTFKSSSTRHNEVCSRSQCNRKFTKKPTSMCDQCRSSYCSSKCMKEDRKIHQNSCKITIMKDQLVFLLNLQSKQQIQLLAQIFELGRRFLGEGFILWNIENDTLRKTLYFHLPRFELLAETRRLNVEGLVKEMREHDFLCVLTSKDNVSNSFVVLPRCFEREIGTADVSALSPVKVIKHSNLNYEERENLFNKIVDLLHSFNVDIQEKSPAVYFKLVEYVMSGCWFIKQVITIREPCSGSPLRVVIEPDQLPKQIDV